ncbi:acetate/propionate family kinase [Nitrospira sp. T9]|uniref:acetate/propionate family kinase n=1 Tax=unclassified Nitrospira TaxID=2652172 RepID=UPI003F9DA733
MRILVLNSGSSSVKFRVLDVDPQASPREIRPDRALIKGAVKGIGNTASFECGVEEKPFTKITRVIANHHQAIRWLFEQLEQLDSANHHPASLAGVEAVGHRVVHGGERFSQSVVISDEVMSEIDTLGELAPLHNPACLEGIRGVRAILGPQVPMVAVFDTAFHATMPSHAKMYALPHALANRHHIRRYGFHGIAHASLAGSYFEKTRRPSEPSRLITVQLGNGCSISAIKNGQSVETSMGFTPLEGLVMGTRCGDLDPSIVSYLCQQEKVEPTEVERWLNEQSGLLGLSGRTNDMRELLQAADREGHEPSQMAIDVFCYRVKKYIGAYLAVLGGADALIFGGGIGEAAPVIRRRICEGMEWCGLRLDPSLNSKAVRLQPGDVTRISKDEQPLEVYVGAADEETWIARETVRCLEGTR